MPLPEGGKDAQWPPADVKPYIDQATTATAWWSGQHTQLQAQSGQGGDSKRRRFWQRRSTSDASKATAKLHAPLPADIAAVSADLLFGDPVQITIEGGEGEAGEAVQEQVERLEEELGLANTFLEGAEMCSATGGTYLRCAWDDKIADHGLLQTYAQTHAVPDFRYGRLAAVTLWEDVYVSGTEVWRHLERHEPGRILHGLYKGTATSLGSPAPLGDHPVTADLQPEVTLTGRLDGRLLVSYVPNALPNRITPLRPIGRADIIGSEDFLDALDETWTSLMRDVRLGQAHVFVSQEWLQAAGGRPGQTKTLDMDTEIFTALNADQGTEAWKMELIQAKIRVEEHIALSLGLTERVVSAAGYSPQTFGLQIEGRAETGTALRLRKEKTEYTQAKKRRYWQPGLVDTVQNLLDIGAEFFGQPTVDPGENAVKVEWGELQRDPAEQAAWIKSMREARAMSIETAVATGQPDLEVDQRAEEVERIKLEDQVANPVDPLDLP